MKNLVISALLLGSASAQAAICEIKLPRNHASEQMAEALKTKGYVASETGSYRLNVRMNIDHRGRQYVIAGYTVNIEDPQRNELSAGTKKYRPFRSEESTIMKAFEKALKNLPECPSQN
jgi:hypothetical protein